MSKDINFTKLSLVDTCKLNTKIRKKIKSYKAFI